MSHELIPLTTAAAFIVFTHTLFGPDHYLPFIVMSKSGKWSFKKTTLITFVCGLGHALSSVALGSIGIVFGVAVTKLKIFESFSGGIAAWALIAFGLVYFIWGIKRAIRNKPHTHLHVHQDGISHVHTHTHNKEHAHAHVNKKNSITPWVLFAIFVFGPCEPLIPLLMYPAAKHDFVGLILVAVVCTLVTIGTMMSVVLMSVYGISLVPLAKLERYTHALAGLIIFLCGAAIQFLGL